MSFISLLLVKWHHPKQLNTNNFNTKTFHINHKFYRSRQTKELILTTAAAFGQIYFILEQMTSRWKWEAVTDFRRQLTRATWRDSQVCHLQCQQQTWWRKDVTEEENQKFRFQRLFTVYGNLKLQGMEMFLTIHRCMVLYVSGQISEVCRESFKTKSWFDC